MITIQNFISNSINFVTTALIEIIQSTKIVIHDQRYKFKIMNEKFNPKTKTTIFCLHRQWISFLGHAFTICLCVSFSNFIHSKTTNS